MHTFPRYPKKPHSTGKARIRLHGRDVYLNGPFGSPESKAHYAKLTAQFAASPTVPIRDGATVAEVIVLWRKNALDERGEDCKEIKSVLIACGPLLRLFGTDPAASIDCEKLETVREAMISGSWMNAKERAVRAKKQVPVGWCRSNVNHACGRIRTVWRWAERKKLVPPGSWGNLCALGPIPKFRKVRSTEPGKPVSDETVAETLKVVSPIIGAMIQVHLASGMRPNDLVQMHADEIEIGADGIGEYRCEFHKNRWRDGQGKTVVLPTDAVNALLPWLEAARRIGADIPLWRYNRDPRVHYTPAGYYRAIKRACRDNGIEEWYPYQLRHRCKERVTRSHGLDAARAVLGQKSISATDRYASAQDVKTAKQVAIDAKKTA